MIRRSILTTLFLVGANLFASPADEAWEAWLAGDFKRVEQLATDFRDDAGLDSVQRARLQLALGCADAMRGSDAAAVKSFEIALMYDPNLELSASDLPPPVWKVYQPVRDRLKKQPDSFTSQLTLPDTLRIIEYRIDTTFVPEPVYRRSSIAVRSLIFPGWGHLVEDRRRGYLFTGIEVLALTGFALSAMETADAREDYLSAREVDAVNDRYDVYNRAYQLTWSLAIIAAANYLVAQLDFFTTPPPLTLSISRMDPPASESKLDSMRLISVSLTLKL